MIKTIFKNGYLDAFFIFFPIIFSIFLSEALTSLGEVRYLFLAIIVTSIVDSGHVYITAWRTWLHGGLEIKPKQFLYLPIAIFITVFLWNYLQIKGLWAFVVYFTVYHNIRQLYGVNKLYQSTEQKISQTRDFFLYIFCYISFLAFHFRTSIPYEYYASDELFLYPNHQLLKLCVSFLILASIAWVFIEAYYYFKNKKIDLGSLFFSIGGSIIYVYAFLFSKNELQLMAPLVLTHGTHYYFLTTYACVRTKTLFYKKIKTAFVVIFLSGAAMGATELYLENNVFNLQSKTLASSFIIALYLVPLLSHFLFDAIIWKKNYPEFKAVTTKDNTI